MGRPPSSPAITSPPMARSPLSCPVLLSVHKRSLSLRSRPFRLRKTPRDLLLLLSFSFHHCRLLHLDIFACAVVRIAFSLDEWFLFGSRTSGDDGLGLDDSWRQLRPRTEFSRCGTYGRQATARACVALRMMGTFVPPITIGPYSRQSRCPCVR